MFADDVFVYQNLFSLLLMKTIKSKDAWNSPENSTDFPRCHFEISHVDETKQSFFCGITASHGNDTAETEVIEFYEEVSKKG